MTILNSIRAIQDLQKKVKQAESVAVLIRDQMILKALN